MPWVGGHIIRALILWAFYIHHNKLHAGLGGETPLECLSKSYGACQPPDARTMRLVFAKPQEGGQVFMRLTVQGLLGVSDLQSGVVQSRRLIRRSAQLFIKINAVCECDLSCDICDYR